MKRVSVVGVMASILACLATLGAPHVARAECPWFVIPPATEAARSAREVLVGRVVENVGDQLYDFRLEVDHVLRGPARAGEVRRFNRVFPGWPLAETPAGTAIPPCEAIPGWEGNVIALALGALAPDGTTRYNAASWISGIPLHRDDVPRTTLDEMMRLAALPETATVSPATPSSRAPPPPIEALLLGAFALSALAAVAARSPGTPR